MKKRLESRTLRRLFLPIAAFAIVMLNISDSPADQTKKKTDVSVAHAKKTVRMLDDLYKTAIVLITQTYVEDEASTPAAAAVVPLWEAMEKKGWHKVRLVDATGDPYDTDNVAKSDFEKKHINKLTAKNAYVDQVVTDKEGNRYLEAMTFVPMVMEKCTLCHPNYNDLPKGAAVGAVSYRIPIESIQD